MQRSRSHWIAASARGSRSFDGWRKVGSFQLHARDGAVPPRRDPPLRGLILSRKSTENQMYIGGGILGTLLLVLLIVYLMRRV